MSSEIPAASRVLVTGASAFLSSHIIHQLLCAGFNVRAAVRELPQADWMKEYFSHNFNQKFDGSNRLEIAVVPDMATAGAYDEAIKGISIPQGNFLRIQLIESRLLRRRARRFRVNFQSRPQQGETLITTLYKIILGQQY